MNGVQAFIAELWHELTQLVKERRREFVILAIVVLALSGGMAYLLSSVLPDELTKYGYLGAFLVCLVCSSTVIVVPFSGPAGLAVTLTIAQTVDLKWLVPIVAAIGGSLGEITGYAAGYGGRRIMGATQDSSILRQVEGWIKRYGPLTIPAVAFFPLGVFDFMAIAFGSARFPAPKFLALTFAGRLPRSFLEIYLGTGLLDLLTG
jgi:membrane protein YqaA with SNARE-associated domain